VGEFYDRLGVPIDLYEWGRLQEDLEYKVIAREKVGDVEVSTVWLGLNHNFWPGRPPLIFETMFFPACEVCERYSTEDDARVGHAAAVMLLRAELGVVPDGK
jgi:hypothetical protein